MLTSKRTELSKQVRQAKKDNFIEKYAIDQNGRIFVKKIGDDLRFHQVYSVNDNTKRKLNQSPLFFSFKTKQTLRQNMQYNLKTRNV